MGPWTYINVRRGLVAYYPALTVLLFLFSGCGLSAQTDLTNTDQPRVIEFPQKTVELEILDKTFFVGRVATAVVYFDSVVGQPEDSSPESNTCSVIDVEVVNTPESKKSQAVATLHFLPKRSGIVTLPALIFKSEAYEYLIEPKQVLVSEQIRSSEISLKLEPTKQRVYVGEPVRFNLTWDCNLDAGALKALRIYPEFFQDDDIEVVIPRNTDAEEVQVGLPIGGRRVIAKRSQYPGNERALGVVTLPIYLRFTEAGNHVLPETRLECVQLAKPESDFGRYAAHFNNSLFEAADSRVIHDRIYTVAPPVEIEVLPLPPEPHTPFSNLYAPLDIEVSVRPTELEIGQLIELGIKLTGDAPHGMLELPLLSQMAPLRERFLVDDNYGRFWHEQGSTFKVRLRVLSTSVEAFPSLHFQVFDPESGNYVVHSTQAIPLKVHASDGQDFISLKSFSGAVVKLSNQPDGIWHNLVANSMNDLLNTLYNFVRDAFGPLILLGPIAFILLLPIVRERRRRRLDAHYRHCLKAYAELKKHPSETKEKWRAFLRFMAITFKSGNKAWTCGDSIQALKKIHANDSDLEDLVEMHTAVDAEDFSQRASKAKFKNLDGIAKRVSRLAANSLLVLLVVLFIAVFSSQSVRADEWSQAEGEFAKAQSSVAGSAVASSLYQDAALKFQVVARTGQRPGAAWYNAGNAWFQVGAIGRAVAAYREAQAYRPFDKKLADNLAAARALRLNDVPALESWWRQVPKTGVKVLVVLLNLIFWSCLLLTLLYRKKAWLLATVSCGTSLTIASTFLIGQIALAKVHGVVVVDTAYGKKGPSYAYANAFNEPLHDGLEFTLIEQREDWGLIELPDARQSWLPIGQIQLIGD